MKDRASDLDADVPEPSRGIRIGKQIVSQRRVKVENGVTVEADVLCRIDEKFDGLFVVEDHLRFVSLFPLRLFAGFDQTRGIEQGVRVAFQAARIPREVD